MKSCQTLPRLWLFSDARNDQALEQALKRLPRGSGFIYRHYHLASPQRQARFDRLERIARAHGHQVFVAGDELQGADGLYARRPKRGGPWLATAHNLREIGRANREGASAVLLSPAFPTRSHPQGKTLGPLRFRLLARYAEMPVIALGGMTRSTARRLGWKHWAAIDGLS